MFFIHKWLSVASKFFSSSLLLNLGLFRFRCFIVSKPSTEKLKIDPFVFVDRTLSSEAQDESDDEDEKAAAVARFV